MRKINYFLPIAIVIGVSTFAFAQTAEKAEKPDKIEEDFNRPPEHLGALFSFLLVSAQLLATLKAKRCVCRFNRRLKMLLDFNVRHQGYLSRVLR